VAGAKRKAKADAEASASAPEALQRPLAVGEVVRFVSFAGVVCEAVVQTLDVDGTGLVRLLVKKPSGMTFVTLTCAGDAPGYFQRKEA
jgi:hypothetical protein